MLPYCFPFLKKRY